MAAEYIDSARLPRKYWNSSPSRGISRASAICSATCLVRVVDLSLQSCVALAQGLDSVLQFAFLQLTELVSKERGLSVNLAAQDVGLVQCGKLVLISLTGNAVLDFASAAGNLVAQCAATLLELVGNH